MEGYQSLQTDGSFYGSTVDKAKRAAETYKAQMSPHLQWMEEEGIEVDPNAPTDPHEREKPAVRAAMWRMNAHEAWRSYKQSVMDDNPMHKERKKEFRENLEAVTGGKVTYDRFGDERVFIGMRRRHDACGVNVVPFTAPGVVGS